MKIGRRTPLHPRVMYPWGSLENIRSKDLCLLISKVSSLCGHFLQIFSTSLLAKCVVWKWLWIRNRKESAFSLLEVDFHLNQNSIVHFPGCK